MSVGGGLCPHARSYRGETNADFQTMIPQHPLWVNSNRYSELDTTLTGHEDPRDLAHDRAPSLKKEYGLSDDSLAQPNADDSPSPVFMGLGAGDGGNAGLVECCRTVWV